VNIKDTIKSLSDNDRMIYNAVSYSKLNVDYDYLYDKIDIDSKEIDNIISKLIRYKLLNIDRDGNIDLYCMQT